MPIPWASPPSSIPSSSDANVSIIHTTKDLCDIHANKDISFLHHLLLKHPGSVTHDRTHTLMIKLYHKSALEPEGKKGTFTKGISFMNAKHADESI